MKALPVLLLSLLAACAAGPGGDCRPEVLAELPVRLVHNVPVLSVEINGQPASMVLDTGSDATVLTQVAASRLGIGPTDERRTVSAAGGRARVGVARLDAVRLGPLALTDVRALLGNAPRPPIDGVIGINVLVGYEVELDAPHRRAVFARARACSTAAPEWAASGSALAVQQQAGSGHLFVPVELNGQGLRGLLDTGASLTTLSLQTAEDAGVSRRQLAAMPSARGEAINPEGIEIRAARFERLRVGNATLEHPTLAIADLPQTAGDMLVGSDYLGTRRVWFSFRLGRVFVAP